jgi:hypothetical protein
MSDEGYDWRKVVAYLVGGIVALYVVVWIFGYLTHGNITVKTTDPDNIVKVVRVVSDESKPFSKQLNGSSDFRVKPGTYTVSVFQNGGTYGTSQTVSVKARQRVVVSLDPARTVGAQPVFGEESPSMFITDDKLLFLDPKTSAIKQIDSSGNLVTLFPNYRFRGIRWNDSGQAIAQATDNKLYLINNGSIKPLLTPFNLDGNSVVNYDISPVGQIYISNGGNIYKKGGSTFKKIYSGRNTVKLFASDDALAVISLGQREGANSLLTIMASGAVNKKVLDATQASWSPDGKFLVVNNNGNYVVLDKTLEQVKLFSAPQSSALIWRNDHSVVYTIANQLWTYDVLSARSNQLALLGAGNNITNIFINQGMSYIYLSATGPIKNGVFRVALNGQRYNTSLNALGSFLPKSIGVCSLDYVNFVKPVITINYPALETSPALCINAAQSQLRYFGLNPNSFRYITQATTNTPDDIVKGY